MWRWLFSLLGPFLALGCGDDAQCLLDTDCPIPMRCEAEQCVPRGAADAGLDGGTGPMDAGGDGGGLDGGTDGGPELVRTGTVMAMQTPLAEPSSSPHSLTATFSVEPVSDACTAETVGECSVSDCLVPAEGEPDAGVPMADGGVMADGGPPADAGVTVAPHAGTITLTGGAMELFLSPGADGTYAPRTGTGLLWTADQSLTIMASGDEVPAFSETLTGPGPITVSAPSFAAGFNIDRAADWTTTWSGGTGTVHVILSNSQVTVAGTRTVQLHCTYGAAEATATIPSDTLGMVPTGPGGSLQIATASQVTSTPDDDWEITVAAVSGALDAEGNATMATVTVTDSSP